MVSQKQNKCEELLLEKSYDNNKFCSISTHCKQNAFLLVTCSILIFLGVTIFCLILCLKSTKPTSTIKQNLQNYQQVSSDYVTLRKVYNFTLSSDDLLYESTRNLNTRNNIRNDYFSTFGPAIDTFRSKTSQFWDPSPEYILNAFGKRLHLILQQHSSFIPRKTFTVINILNNYHAEDEDHAEGHYLGCYYKGYVKDDEQSSVAVSLCHGMTGYIKTSFGSLLIQPVDSQTNVNSPNISRTSEILHKIWRHSRPIARYAVYTPDMDMEEIKQNSLSKLNRKKRSDTPKPLTIELLVAVDRTMKHFHKNLKTYTLTLISIASNIFADASIGNSVDISVGSILVFNGFKRTKLNATASDTLKDFCEYVAKTGYHYDTAMFITRDQICGKQHQTKCDTLGIAEFGSACKRKSCALVHDTGLQTAFTIAHELGHVLNMPHDDDDRCKQFKKSGAKSALHLMSSHASDETHPWSWSDCSRHHISEFIEQEDTTCLEDTPTKFLRNYNTRLPGEIYSLNHQCKLIHGNKSISYCSIDTDCKRLWCKTRDSNMTCRSSNLPWADGTPCNNKSYWCQKGECVPRTGEIRPVVNGGWGPWSPWSQCSLTCGGGIQKSQRECNNPLPKNGGKYCTGSRKKYRSCSTQNCPPGTMDVREQQCYQKKGVDIGRNDIGRHTKWIPKYGSSPQDNCNLDCHAEGSNVNVRFSEKVIDGTPCSLDSFDKCVNGVCRPAGCDNELNSNAKLDKCGVCEGRNDTCKDITGNFYVSDLYKMPPKYNQIYYHVTTIPKGASNIVIEQRGYRDENYIALRDDKDILLLNDNLLLKRYPYVGFYAGVAFDYNGFGSSVERVNTTYNRKLKRDLIVEILSLSKNSKRDNGTILMTYSYTIDKTN